jgi:hypothetical protein
MENAVSCIAHITFTSILHVAHSSMCFVQNIQNHTRLRPQLVKEKEIAVLRVITVQVSTLTTKLHGLSPRANYTDRVTAACRRSDCQLLRIVGAMWSA